jgi:predicted secreted protein
LAPCRRSLFAAYTAAALLCGGGSITSACASAISPTADASDIVLTREQFGTSVSIKVGNTISIPLPADREEWQVDFASPPLELLNPPEKRSRPGISGWRFRAIAPGESDVVLTPITTGDAPPPQFIITIHVAP